MRYHSISVVKCVHGNAMFYHGCIKPVLTTDNCYIDKPMNFYSNQYFFEHNAWSAFRHAFRMQITYKSGKITLMLIFPPQSGENVMFQVQNISEWKHFPNRLRKYLFIRTNFWVQR